MTKIIVLMSTYNGEKYLTEQIISIFNQKNVEVKLIVRDDGSSDTTLEILTNFLKDGYNISISTGDNIGPAKSFMTLLAENYTDDINFYAFSDQDDIWLPNKLDMAIRKIGNTSKPALYFSSSTLVDNQLEVISVNTVNRLMNFEESLIRNNCQGSTMVFNKELAEKSTDSNIQDIVMHDMWIHIIAQIFNANIFVDSKSHMLYRQHEKNVLGVNNNLFLKMFLKIKSYTNNSNNLRKKMLINIVRDYINEIPLEKLDSILLLVNNDNRLDNKVRILKNNDYFEGTFFQNVSFCIDILFNRY